VQRVIQELQQNKFSFIVCDSPAGIESGARHAMYVLELHKFYYFNNRIVVRIGFGRVR
jgi:hypothetical protein